MAREKTVNLDENTVDMAALESQIRAKIEAEKEAEIKALEDKIKQSEAGLESQIRSEEKTVKQQLKEMKKVLIEIPEDPNNPDDIVPVGYNGVIYSIPRGQQFEVPEAIYNIWKESYDKTKEVNKRIRDSVKKEITTV